MKKLLLMVGLLVLLGACSFTEGVPLSYWLDKLGNAESETTARCAEPTSALRCPDHGDRAAPDRDAPDPPAGGKCDRGDD